MSGQNASGEFAGLLRRYRERAALTQEELAERAQVTAKAISALECGERRRPYPHTVRALAEALRLDDAEPAALSAAARPHAGTDTAPTPTLPAPPSELIGRDRERADSIDLLRAGTRLLTLTGPGGVGKTSLSFDVARTVAPEFQGDRGRRPCTGPRDAAGAGHHRPRPRRPSARRATARTGPGRRVSSQRKARCTTTMSWTSVGWAFAVWVMA